MELNELKSTWQHAGNETKSREALDGLIRSAKGTVFQRIRRQLTIESVSLTLFLICYYGMFDGQDKPAAVNAVLISATLVAILHGVYGYRLVRTFPATGHLIATLQVRRKNMRSFAIFAVVSKLVYALALILFFTSGLELTQGKWIAISVLLSVILLQLLLLSRIWVGRLNRMDNLIADYQGLEERVTTSG